MITPRAVFPLSPVWGMLVISSCLTAATTRAAPSEYFITDLGDVSDVWDINNHGTITGSRNQRGFTYSRGVFMDWETLGGTNSYGRGLNDDGVVAGASTNMAGQWLGVVWDGNDLTPLPITRASAVNSSYQFVGVLLNSSGQFAALIDADEVELLPSLDISESSWATDINDLGQVVGVSNDQDGGHAVIWEEGAIASVMAADSSALRINNHGVAVGIEWDHDRGFVWDGASVELLQSADGGRTYARGINDMNQVVGHAFSDDESSYAVLWENGVAINLTDLLANGDNWHLQSAYDINNSEEIIGFGFVDGERHGFLLTPEPLPKPTPVVGDMDGSGVVDAFDVDDFEQALTRVSEYVTTHPGLDPFKLGDIDGNGYLDAFDVDDFELLLAGDGAVVPEPGVGCGLLLSGIALHARYRR